MKVVLASVSFTTPYTPQRRFLSLGYLHANAAQDDVVGPATDIVHNYYDPSLYDAAEVAEQIAVDEPDILAFTCYVWNTPDVIRICEQVKTLMPQCRIILGGPEVSYAYRRFLDENPFIDWIGVNEGEETFREFLRAIVQGEEDKLAELPGLAQRKPDGESFLPAQRSYLRELDVLPSPYLTGVLDVCDVRGGANYQTARGCPFTCSYCDYGRNQPYFEFSLERVAAEMDFFKQHDARLLFNVDPTFNYSRARAEAILGMMIERDMEAIHWFEVFPSLINDDLIELVSDSYGVFMGVGIQTCTHETMRNIKRVWRPEKVAPLLDQLKRKPNVILSYEIIMGLPGDNVQNYVETMNWTYEREPAEIKSFNLAILPRTPLEQQTEQWGIEFDADAGHEILKTDFMDHQEVMVGKAINDWHRMLQGVFVKLRKVTGRPAGELIRDWAWTVYNAGQHGNMASFQTHRIGEELVEPLAELWEGFVAGECEKAGVPDLSRPLREELRYHYYRRSRTLPSAFFADTRDIYFNEPYPEVHRYWTVTRETLPEPRADAADQRPRLGGEVDHRRFEYDLTELHVCDSLEDIVAVQPKTIDTLIFMTPDTGAGCPILCDDWTRAFVELVDGQRTVAEIGALLEEPFGADAREAAPALYTALAATGIFERPRILTKHEEGRVTWKSAFPEAYRLYH